eukprot:scaffold51254_cov17-Tisochrysis_lutea.AAC.2
MGLNCLAGLLEHAQSTLGQQCLVRSRPLRGQPKAGVRTCIGRGSASGHPSLINVRGALFEKEPYATVYVQSHIRNKSVHQLPTSGALCHEAQFAELLGDACSGGPRWGFRLCEGNCCFFVLISKPCALSVSELAPGLYVPSYAVADKCHVHTYLSEPGKESECADSQHHCWHCLLFIKQQMGKWEGKVGEACIPASAYKGS